MNKILSLEHWQAFLILLFAVLINNTTIEDYSTITSIIGLIGFILYFLILAAYGHYLHELLPKKLELNYNLFILNVFVVFATGIFTVVLTEDNQFSLTGIYALPGFYIAYAFLHVMVFPMKTLKSLELNRRAQFGEYIGLYFMLIFWPFCIWALQPRINRVARQGNVLAGSQSY